MRALQGRVGLLLAVLVWAAFFYAALVQVTS